MKAINQWHSWQGERTHVRCKCWCFQGWGFRWCWSGVRLGVDRVRDVLAGPPLLCLVVWNHLRLLPHIPGQDQDQWHRRYQGRLVRIASRKGRSWGPRLVSSSAGRYIGGITIGNPLFSLHLSLQCQSGLRIGHKKRFGHRLRHGVRVRWVVDEDQD